jgi:AAA family ATP:ADP antiporter
MSETDQKSLPSRLLALLAVEPHELKPVLLAFTWFFFLLGGYYVLRPLREEMGVAGGVRNLPYLFLGTLSVMLVLTPVMGTLFHRFDRRQFIPWITHFFVLNLLLFFLFLKILPASQTLWVGRLFYVWISVFNLVAVSLFWSFLADFFVFADSKRLFGLLAIGGSAGGLVGSGMTAFLVESLGRVNLLLVAVAFLEAGLVAFHFLSPLAKNQSAAPQKKPISHWSSAFEAIPLVLKSPVLILISTFLFFYSIVSTTLYFQQAQLVDMAFTTREAKASFFGQLDFWINFLTIGFELLLTSRLIKTLGIGLTIGLLPLVGFFGFLALWMHPVIGVLAVFQVLRRATNFGLSKPAKEAVYATLSRSEKYKAKNFIDTFVYRGGDALGAMIFNSLKTLGWTLTQFSAMMIPVCLLWGAVALNIGWLTKKKAMEQPSISPQGS